jgi:hypothetical protein
MRRYNIVRLILLILSTINFALTAPVQVPEKCQACVDVVHVPKDVVTVLGKQGDDLEKLAKLFGKLRQVVGGLGRLENSRVVISRTSAFELSTVGVRPWVDISA